MKVLLMRPQSHLKKIIPMGLMYLAGYIRKFLPEIDIEIVDLRQNSASEKDVSNIIYDRSPDIVGIASVSMEAKLTHSLTRIIKHVNKDISVVIGGPYATSLPHFTLKDNNVLCCVIGEGEETMRELIVCIKDQSQISDVKGIGYSANGKFITNAPREYISNIDSIPIPAYDLIDEKQYFRDFGTHSGFQAHKEYSSIFTSRGCPYKCTYCHDIFGKSIRYHSAERVFNEINILYHKYGVREIHIEDDSFNINRKRVKDIFNLIKSNGLDIKIAFPNGIRVDLVNENILNLFKDVGVYRLAYGIESGSEKIQKGIGKGLNLESAKENIQLTAKKGISTHGFFMLGFLGETKEEILQTIDFALKSKLHTASFSFVIPQPGTKLYSEALREGFDIEKIDTDQLNPGDTEINISAVSIEELHKLRRKAYKRFYMNIGRLYRLYQTTPKKILLFKSFLVFLTNILPIPIDLRERAQGLLYK